MAAGRDLDLLKLFPSDSEDNCDGIHLEIFQITSSEPYFGFNRNIGYKIRIRAK